VAAVEAWLDGCFSDACAVWEDVLVEHPNDAIAMFAAHQADFFLGQASELCHRVARRLPDMDKGSALEGYYWGMYAFGLEEIGDYAKALDVGRRAVGRGRKDAWAIHAVAHVFEMTNRVDEGEQWLLSHASDWVDSNLAVHIWWHLALYYCDQRRWDRVLELYDAGIRRAASNVAMELLDASALLWRLKLYDIDVGNRWQGLADAWETRIGEAWYAFNDMHAMMAFAGAGRFDLAQRLIAVLRATAAEQTDNRAPGACPDSSGQRRRIACTARCAGADIAVGRGEGGANPIGSRAAQRAVGASATLDSQPKLDGTSDGFMRSARPAKHSALQDHLDVSLSMSACMRLLYSSDQ
jgi:tetratricopeptide (TPR) repeat protein